RAVKVKAKMFLIVSQEDGILRASMKLPDSNRYALTQPYAKPTGYNLGKSGWVTCTFGPDDELPLDLLEEWIDESYRAIAPKKLVLTLNARLGGAEPMSAPPTPTPPAPPPPKAAKTPAAKPRKKT
ncbi:MAG: MmcQ/YjbR family DNA-binding protein, partial [Gemmataceae bacterium]|nr:MmcQ/YjbR family DNA-binding protein [Gemmataceae bacterium]